MAKTAGNFCLLLRYEELKKLFDTKLVFPLTRGVADRWLVWEPLVLFFLLFLCFLQKTPYLTSLYVLPDFIPLTRGYVHADIANMSLPIWDMCTGQGIMNSVCITGTATKNVCFWVWSCINCSDWTNLSPSGSGKVLERTEFKNVRLFCRQTSHVQYWTILWNPKFPDFPARIY